MATNRFDIASADGWVEVAPVTVAVLVENQSTKPVRVAFSAAAPTVESASHLLHPNQRMARGGAGKVWVRSLVKEVNGVVAPSLVVVSQ